MWACTCMTAYGAGTHGQPTPLCVATFAGNGDGNVCKTTTHRQTRCVVQLFSASLLRRLPPSLPVQGRESYADTVGFSLNTTSSLVTPSLSLLTSTRLIYETLLCVRVVQKTSFDLWFYLPLAIASLRRDGRGNCWVTQITLLIQDFKVIVT